MPASGRALVFSHLSFHGIEDLLGIEAYPVLEHPDDLPDVADILGNITIDDHEIGGLADFDGADLVLQSEGLRTVIRSDPDGLYRAEPGVRQQFDRLL